MIKEVSEDKRGGTWGGGGREDLIKCCEFQIVEIYMTIDGKSDFRFESQNCKR